MHCVCTYDVRCQGNAKARSRGASRPGTLDSCARTYGRAQAPWACAIDTDSETDKSESSERRAYGVCTRAIDTDSETDGSKSCQGNAQARPRGASPLPEARHPGLLRPHVRPCAGILDPARVKYTGRC